MTPCLRRGPLVCAMRRGSPSDFAGGGQLCPITPLNVGNKYISPCGHIFTLGFGPPSLCLSQRLPVPAPPKNSSNINLGSRIA